MPAATEPLRIIPLDSSLRKSSQIGAEIKLPEIMTILGLDDLTEQDQDILRQGLYEHNVLVIRNQGGISPATLPGLGKLFDKTAWDIHSGGSEAVKDPKNILAANRAARLPQAPQVTVIGQGEFSGYQGIDKMSLKHVV